MITGQDPKGVNSITFREVIYPDPVTLKPQHYVVAQYKVGMHGPFTLYYPSVSFNADTARQDMNKMAASLTSAGAHGLT